jgi:hypothetical protein
VIDRIVDRVLHTVSDPHPLALTSRAPQGPGESPVVDLLVGTVLFRRTLLQPLRYGHVDLPRFRAGGVRLVGMSIATRFPDLRGTLSALHFLCLGVPPRVLRSDIAIVRFMIGRVDRWAAASGGTFAVVRTRRDLEAVLAPNGPVGAFVGVQGAQALEGTPRTSGAFTSSAFGCCRWRTCWTTRWQGPAPGGAPEASPRSGTGRWWRWNAPACSSTSRTGHPPRSARRSRSPRDLRCSAILGSQS